MKQQIVHIARCFALWLSGVSFNTAWFFASWKGSGNTKALKRFQKKGTTVFYAKNNLDLPIGILHIFNTDLAALQKCVEAHSPVPKDNGLLLSATVHENTINVFLSSSQSLFVFNEVFDQQVYGFCVPQHCVVVDVGMNIGMSALYFASHPYVEKVYGFELIPATYQLACTNINLNPAIAKKIIPHAYGWGTSNGSYDMHSAQPADTDATIQGMQLVQPGQLQSQTLATVKAAATELQQLLQQHANTPIVLKLDAEGVEYDIIPLLQETGLLQQMQGVMIEWHNRGYEPLVSSLTAAGFKTTIRPDAAFEGRLGMIYAWK